jgi:hypothetical protein
VHSAWQDVACLARDERYDNIQQSVEHVLSGRERKYIHFPGQHDEIPRAAVPNEFNHHFFEFLQKNIADQISGSSFRDGQ